MNGLIDENGRLKIERNGKLILTDCRSNNYISVCDHRCSRFGEPERGAKETFLQLCTSTLCFENFKDERKI